MQVNHFFMLHAALAAAQLSAPGDDDTPSRDNALTAKAEGGGPAAATPSSLHTDYSSLNTISNPDTTAKVDPNTAVETPISNNPPDSEAGLPVGSTGVDDAELERGSPQFLASNQPIPVPEPVQPETAPPEAVAQVPEQAASPPTETTGIFTSDSPSSPIATTPVVALNQPTFYKNFAPVPGKDPVQTPTVTPSPAEATKAAILAVPNSSSQVSELPSSSASTPDPNFNSPSASPPVTATTDTTIPAPSTTFLSIITSPTDSELGFVALATDSSSSLTSSSTSPLATPSPTSSPNPSSPPSSSSSLSSTTSTTTTSNTTSQPAMASNTSNTDNDTSLQQATTSYPHSSNEYLSSQAKVAIALVSVVGVLAVMAVIGYVLWHMRMRDKRLERNRAALARGVGVGGAGVGAGGTGKEGNGAQGHKRNLSVEEKMKQALEKEHDVPLDVGKLQSDQQGGKDAAKAAVKTAVSRFSTISTISESSEDSEDGQGSVNHADALRQNNEPLAVMAAPMPIAENGMASASQKEIGLGYGLGRSESQESEESHYSEGGQDEFGRSETLEGQRARYVHERSESLRTQWSDVEDYYGIERLETEVQRQGPGGGSAGDAGGAGAEALESEETLVRTESSASTESGRSGATVGKAL